MSAHANRQRSSHAEWDKAYRIRVAGRLGNPELTQPCERGQYAQSIDKLRIMKSNNARLPPYWVLDGIEYSSHSKRDGSRRIIYTKKMRLFDSYEEAVAGIPHFLEAIKRDGVSITRMLDKAVAAPGEEGPCFWCGGLLDLFRLPADPYDVLSGSPLTAPLWVCGHCYAERLQAGADYVVRQSALAARDTVEVDQAMLDNAELAKKEFYARKVDSAS